MGMIELIDSAGDRLRVPPIRQVIYDVQQQHKLGRSRERKSGYRSTPSIRLALSGASHCMPGLRNAAWQVRGANVSRPSSIKVSVNIRESASASLLPGQFQCLFATRRTHTHTLSTFPNTILSRSPPHTQDLQ